MDSSRQISVSDVVTSLEIAILSEDNSQNSESLCVFLSFCSAFSANNSLFNSKIHSVILYTFLHYFKNVPIDAPNGIDIHNIRHYLMIIIMIHKRIY